MTRWLVLVPLIFSIFSMTPVAGATLGFSPGYAASMRQLIQWSTASPYVTVHRFGTSAAGRPLQAAIVSSPPNSTSVGALTAHKLVVFVLSGLDVGDVAGKDASLAWLKQVADAARSPGWLKQLTVVVVPALNADGLARLSGKTGIPVTQAQDAAFQGTPGLVDLRHDFLYARSAAVRSWLRLVRQWQPDVYIVLRTNLRQPPGRYRLAWSQPPPIGYALPVARWLHAAFGDLTRLFYRVGLGVTSCYQARRLAVLEAGLQSCPPEKGGLAQLALLDNRPELTLILPRDQDYSRAVEAGTLGLKTVLSRLAGRSRSLLDALARAERDPLGGKSRFPIGFDFRGRGDSRRFDGYQYTTMLSPISGTVWARYLPHHPKTYVLPWARNIGVTGWLKPWPTYALSGAWRRVIDLLKLHGVTVQTVTKPRNTRAAIYYLDQSPESGLGREPRAVAYTPVMATVTLPMGSVIIPGSQPQAKLVAALLLPRSPVAVIHGGYLRGLSTTHVMVPNAALEQRARDELSKNPNLARKFARRLAENPEFARSPSRRLAFFLRHSGSQQPLLDVYPVYRLAPPGK